MNTLRWKSYTLLSLLVFPLLYLGCDSLLKFMVFTMLAATAFFYIEFQIFQPLKRLERKAEAFHEGEIPEYIEMTSHDGIGTLERKFESATHNAISRVNELKELDRAKSEFVSIASHELRTPLTSIKGSIGLLTSGTMGEIPVATLRMLQIAESETDRLIALINELLDLAKIEARHMSLKPEWTLASELLPEVASSIEGLAATKALDILVKTDPEIELWVDRGRVKQIAQNLLANAIKYSPEGGQIQFTLSQEGEMAKMAVTDEGIGICSKDITHIFEKFRQCNEASGTSPGTGLGLTIARELAHLHKATIHVDSTLGMGSTFYVLFTQWRKAARSSETATGSKEAA